MNEQMLTEFAKSLDDCANGVCDTQSRQDCQFFLKYGTLPGCIDALMTKAVHVLELLYTDRRDRHYDAAMSVVYWLKVCSTPDHPYLCRGCPFAVGCPDELIRTAATLIRVARDRMILQEERKG